MNRALLDVDALLALLDSDHVRAGEWWDAEVEGGWASCPTTENGFARITSQPRYPSPVPPAAAIEVLAAARASRYHAFWPCDVSLLDGQVVDWSRLHGSRQVTDGHRLALAVAHDGRFVTVDRSLSPASVHGATEEHLTVLCAPPGSTWNRGFRLRARRRRRSRPPAASPAGTPSGRRGCRRRARRAAAPG
ncbi:TA system VapC family ribonuclease toxin [Geodermatophilus sp. SYSU D01176]